MLSSRFLLFWEFQKYHFFTSSPTSIHSGVSVSGKRKITSINQCFALTFASSLLYNKLLHAEGLQTHIFSNGIYPQNCSITMQLPHQHLQSCWGFSALRCGVSPHSRSSAMPLLLQPQLAESYVTETKFKQLRMLWGVLKNYDF